MDCLKSQRQNADNERKAKALKRQHEALIDNLEAEKDKLLDKKANLLDLNSKTDVTNWAESYQKVLIDIDILETKIEVANRTQQELFTDEPEEEKKA